MIESLGKTTDPAGTLVDLLSRPNGGCIRLSFSLAQYWLAGEPLIELHALCLAEGTKLSCIITDHGMAMTDALAGVAQMDRTQLESIATTLNASLIDLHRPLMLDTVRIAKPWGAEIWYTGIEQRGVCKVGNTPLPWLVALAGDLICGAAAPELILLKVLDPLPAPVYGDLYFEMHEQKIEVYIVTHIDESAWPNGTGAIRYGFDSDMVDTFESLEDFKNAWLASVNAYRDVRVEIDAMFDQFRMAEGIGPNEVVSPDLIEQWKRRLISRLNDREEEYRASMNAFTRLEPLAPGDVVRVPPFTPHSLQHGVRVVEFQTPHYERFILSFAQKVLTQTHWDTTLAADKIDWHASFDPSLEILESGERHRVDRVADFDAFEVRRVRLAPGISYRLPLDTYALVMAIQANISVCGVHLRPEEACMLPATLKAAELTTEAPAGCFALIAVPKAP